MQIYEAKDDKDMSRKAANIVSAQIIMKPDAVLGLATGATPEGMYAQLADWYDKGDLDFSQVRTVNLDEYRGLPATHAQSYRAYMMKHLFSRVNIDIGKTHLPDGMAADVEQECRCYDALIEALGGIDLQVLGLGRNGHIGFNEPGPDFVLATHRVTLSESTLAANARYFEDDPQSMPKDALTLGMGAIIQARRILLIVEGEEKAEALKKALTGPVTPQVPASLLQLHREVVVVADTAALAGLQ